jgi:hypothetical protein
MILPAPRADEGRRRVVSSVGALVLMLGLYATVRGTPVPSLGSASATVRRLDPLFLERYAAPPPPEAPADAADDEPAPDVSNAGAIDQEVVSAIDELTRRFAGGDGDLGGGGVSRGAQRPEALGGIETDPDDSRFSEVFGGAADPIAPVTAPRARTPAPRVSADGGGGGLAIGERPQRTAATRTAEQDADDLNIAVEAPTQREGRETDMPNVSLKEYGAESFESFEVNALASWMRANAAELPVGVRVHLNYLPSFLTAAAPFAAGDRAFELYLMYNEPLRELHIVLVEGESSVYLIDRGFQAQSRSLREGTVRRVEGEIMTVDSQRRAASGDRAQEFYNIFLSWWEAASTQ